MLIIGHRGAKGLAQENSLDAIAWALKYKVDLIELDVRTTADNIAVLYHDSYTVNKKTNKKLKLSKSSYIYLASNIAGLTTLEEGLSHTKNTGTLIEIKPGADIKSVLKVIKNTSAEVKARMIITSFDYKILKIVSRECPGIKLAVLDKWSGVRASHRAKKLKSEIIIMNQRWLWGGFISSVSRSGLQLFAYTVNNPEKANRWRKFNLAGVITDYPDRFIN